MIWNKEVLRNLNKLDKQLFVRVMDIFLITEKYLENNIKGTKEFPTFECHSTCRAIAEHIGELKVVDGHYLGVSRRRRNDVKLRYCAHSWLTTPSGSIIDPYPVGIFSVNPIMVITRGKYKSFGGNLYWEDKKVTEVIDTEELREKVIVLSRIICEAQTHIIFK
jgi:hypothetical protein